MSEKEVCEAVKTYFQDDFNDFTIITKCNIQFGADRGKRNGEADVVLTDATGHWVVIIECKSEKIGNTVHGRGQLRSYLSATDTRFGILASNGNPDNWVYCENLRSNVFMERKKLYFDQHLSEPPTADRLDQDIINQLKTDNDQLKTDNDQLKTDNDQLKTDNDQLKTDNDQLKTDNDQLKRKLKRVTIGLISALIIAVVSIGFLFLRPTQTDTNYQVIRIIDGDTVEILYEDQITSVQLIGVNAPETTANPNQPPEPYGEQATAFLQEFLLDKSIYLRFDISKRDKYNRLLGYVYRASDSIFVNLEIIREGYGRVDTRYPFKHEEMFMSYESHAKAARKGLWGRYR